MATEHLRRLAERGLETARAGRDMLMQPTSSTARQVAEALVNPSHKDSPAHARVIDNMVTRGDEFLGGLAAHPREVMGHLKTITTAMRDPTAPGSAAKVAEAVSALQAMPVKEMVNAVGGTFASVGKVADATAVGVNEVGRASRDVALGVAKMSNAIREPGPDTRKDFLDGLKQATKPHMLDIAQHPDRAVKVANAAVDIFMEGPQLVLAADGLRGMVPKGPGLAAKGLGAIETAETSAVKAAETSAAKTPETSAPRGSVPKEPGFPGSEGAGGEPPKPPGAPGGPPKPPEPAGPGGPGGPPKPPGPPRLSLDEYASGKDPRLLDPEAHTAIERRRFDLETRGPEGTRTPEYRELTGKLRDHTVASALKESAWNVVQDRVKLKVMEEHGAHLNAKGQIRSEYAELKRVTDAREALIIDGKFAPRPEAFAPKPPGPAAPGGESAKALGDGAATGRSPLATTQSPTSPLATTQSPLATTQSPTSPLATTQSPLATTQKRGQRSQPPSGGVDPHAKSGVDPSAKTDPGPHAKPGDQPAPVKKDMPGSSERLARPDPRVMDDVQLAATHKEMFELQRSGQAYTPAGEPTPRYQELMGKVEQHVEGQGAAIASAELSHVRDSMAAMRDAGQAFDANGRPMHSYAELQQVEKYLDAQLARDPVYGRAGAEHSGLGSEKAPVANERAGAPSGDGAKSPPEGSPPPGDGAVEKSSGAPVKADPALPPAGGEGAVHKQPHEQPQRSESAPAPSAQPEQQRPVAERAFEPAPPSPVAEAKPAEAKPPGAPQPADAKPVSADKAAGPPKPPEGVPGPRPPGSPDGQAKPPVKPEAGSTGPPKPDGPPVKPPETPLPKPPVRG